MLKAVLIVCLFFGLISMVAVGGKKQEWIYLLLLFTLVLSVGADFVRREIFLPESDGDSVETYQALPESQALHSAVASHVRTLTGEYPLSVESDLAVDGEEYRLTYIRVVIRTGDEKEVERALCQTFSFRGFSVIRSSEGSGKNIGLGP